MEYLGVHEISIAQGSTRPLRGDFHYGYDFHGTDGLGVQLPEPKNSLHPVRAPSYIVDLVAAFPDEVTLIALGPLTNIAKALIVEPQLADWLQEIVIMGGALEIPGNVTPHAEFNIFDDPDAAKIVLSSGAHITLVGLDVCEQITVMRDDLPWLSGSSKTANLTNVILNNWFKSHVDRESYSLCDPLAVAAAISPTLLTRQQCSVAVDNREGEYKGKTVAVRGEGQVRVAFGVDVELSKRLMMNLLNGGSE
jgi:purine nucleosidase